MSDDEIEVVAEELAKAGGPSWYPGRVRGPLLRLVTDRHREQARAVIALLGQLRANQEPAGPEGNGQGAPHNSSRQAHISQSGRVPV